MGCCGRETEGVSDGMEKGVQADGDSSFSKEKMGLLSIRGRKLLRRCNFRMDQLGLSGFFS